MKYSLTAAVFAASAAAQSVSSLPTCGQNCFNALVTIAQTQFGCAAGDSACYCANPNFGYGIIDCSNQSCPSPSDAADTIAFGNSYCASALASAASTATATSSASSATSGVSVTTTTQASSTSTVTSTSAGSGPLASVTGNVLPLSGSKGIYVVGGSQTISAGGKPYTSAGVVYSAAKTDVVINGAGATTTVFPGATKITSATVIVSTTGSTTIPKGVTASSNTAIGSVTAGVYVVGGKHTISVGGKPYVHDGTTYTAASSDVVINNAGSSTTYTPTSSVVGVGVSKTTLTTKTGGQKTTATSSQTTSNKSAIKSASSAAKSVATSAQSAASSATKSASGAMRTAAPGLLGAAALALFAL